jgi:hypothetical protein
MSTTSYLDNLVLGKVLNADDFVLGTSFWAALFTSDPGKSGSLGFEVGAAEYARQPITLDSGYANDTLIIFPTAVGAWGTVSHAGLCTSLGGQYLIIYGTLSPGVAVTAGTKVQIDIGSLVVQMP